MKEKTKILINYCQEKLTDLVLEIHEELDNTDYGLGASKLITRHARVVTVSMSNEFMLLFARYYYARLAFSPNSNHISSGYLINQISH